MDDIRDPGAGTVEAKPRALTLRAVSIGLLAVAGVALLTPYNDWYLKNTLMYSQHLPVGVFLLVVLLGVALNPLLSLFVDRKATGWKIVIAGIGACAIGAVIPATTSWKLLAPLWPVFGGLAAALLMLPVLGRGGRFRSGELLVIVGMLLILGSVVSSGLN
nr:hypothetical protein [Planctomycetota bacterium]